MRIRSVSIAGFRNIRREIRLDGLGPLNVIHGDNNVGKSNLVDAIEAVFKFLPVSALGGGLPLLGYRAVDLFEIGGPNATVRVDLDVDWNDEERAALGGKARAAFRWRAALEHGGARTYFDTFDQSAASLAVAGLPSPRLSEPLFLKLPPSRRPSLPNRLAVDAELRVVRSSLANSSPTDPVVVERLARLLVSAGMGSRSDIVPQDLLLALLDARDAAEKPMFERWRLFQDTMRGLSDLLGEGEFVAAYDRANALGELFFETSAGRVPVDRLGTGIQQLVSLIGRLTITRASVVAIEEPELNLRYDLQLRLRDMLARLVEDGRGPEQLILTSHSPAFEWGERFWFMRRTDDGPTIEPRPIAEAPDVTAHRVDDPGGSAHAPLSYVTSEGILRLSENVRAALGVPNGGNVALVEDAEAGRCEILSAEKFFDELGGAREAEQPGVRPTGS